MRRSAYAVTHLASGIVAVLGANCHYHPLQTVGPMDLKQLLSTWKICSEDGAELGQATAILPKTAFMMWHKPTPERLYHIQTSLQRDGTCRLLYQGKVYVLREEIPKQT